MEIRLAQRSDLPQLKTMFEKIVKKMEENGVYIWNEFYTYEEFEIDIEKQQLYLLMDGDVIVATTAMYEFDPTSFNCFAWKDKNAKAMLLNRLGVNVEYLRQGIASKLIEKLKEIAKSKNVKYLRFTVVDSNTPALNLYKKHGFTQVDGIYEEFIPRTNTTLYEFGFEIVL